MEEYRNNQKIYFLTAGVLLTIIAIVTTILLTSCQIVPIITLINPINGPETGSNSIVIKGNNFNGATAVKFGSVSAISFTVNNNNQITTVAPAGTGTVFITVTTPKGTSSGVPYKYMAAPVITSLNPTSGPVTGANTVLISGSGFIGTTQVKFGSNPATFIINSDTLIIATVPNGTGTVSVSVTTAGGTSAGSFYNYVAAPVITSISPTNGPVTGANSIIITGTGFTGATKVNFGLVPTTFTVDNDTQITAIAPSGTGTVSVTVTTVGGISGGLPYTYIVAPIITNLNPIAGPVTGTNSVVITGTGFTGASHVYFGSNPATSFTVNSNTQITAVAPAGTGTVPVTITTAGGTSAGTPYAYVAAPTIVGVSPTSGSETGANSVVITGTGLTGATDVNFDATPAISFTIDNDTQITAVAPAGTGTVQVNVTTPGGTSNGLPYTYIPVSPVIISITPNIGPDSGGNTVIITGTGFTGTINADFGGVPATNFTVNSDTQITAVVPGGFGTINVTVYTPYVISNGVPYTYAPVPVISDLTPFMGSDSGGNSVVIIGTGFTGANRVYFGITPVASFTIDSDNQITAVAPIGTGTVQVTVLTPGGTSNGYAYMYLPAPTISSINPPNGPTSGSNTVTIEGTNLTFTNNVSFGSTPASFVTLSDTQIVAVAPPGIGTVQVTVKTLGGTSNALPYTYHVPSSPVITSIYPSKDYAIGGAHITITGTGFTGAVSVTFGTTPATSFTVDSDTQITAVAPAGTTTPVNVLITTPYGTNAPGPSSIFNYIPLINMLNPSIGPASGGNSVVLTGGPFNDVTGVKFGTVAATNFTIINNSLIMAIAPQNTAGMVYITVTTPYGNSPTLIEDVYNYYYNIPQVFSVNPSSGSTTGGYNVGIIGTGFSGTTNVNFGSVPATSFSVINDSQIIAVAPPQATGLVDVTIQNSAGISVVTPDSKFSYTP